jgi:hypothetical protein
MKGAPMNNVSITRLRVRSLWYMPLFMLHAARTMLQAQRADGIIRVETRFEMNHVVWTKTVWDEESQMKKYRVSGAHQVAMRLLSEICSEASYARWQQPDSTSPTWEEAHRRLLESGKLSKVKHPSAAHAAGVLAPETMRPGFIPPSLPA